MTKGKAFVSEVVAPKRRVTKAYWFAFQEDKLLVKPGSSGMSVLRLMDFRELGLPVLREHYLGRLEDRECYAVQIADAVPPPKGMTFEGLRQVYGLIDEDLFSIAGRAAQIIEWDVTHQFCGRCGTKTRPRPRERAKECPQCGLLHFPRLAPAVIVLVRHGPEILLARARRFSTNMYSTIAGFVEPGETLEQAVVREVHEETGIMTKDIHYFGSQPWPFPHSLMIGFTANYAHGEISAGDGENIDVRWFTAVNLPSLPNKMSIARKLIDTFLEEQKSGRRIDSQKA